MTHLDHAAHLRLRRRQQRRRMAAIALLASVAVGVPTAASAARTPSVRHDVAAVKKATEQYKSSVAAAQAGFGVLYDTAGISCIDMPGMGGMGVHYVSGERVGDPAVKLREPEVLVYAYDRHGVLKLAAVEYVVMKADWDATHDAPPALFGKTFDFTPAGDRYGLPPFYSLHAWVWKHNPEGTFTMWNPRVHCACGDGGHEHAH